MNTLTILLEAAKNNATIKVWGLAQRAYGQSRISMRELGLIQNELRNTNPNFFGA